MKNEYELIFQMPSELARPFIIEMVTNGGYNEFLYIYSKNHSDTEVYLPKISILKLAKIGLALFSDEKKIASLLKDERILAKRINEFLRTIPMQKIKKSGNLRLGNILKKLYDYYSEYCRIYRFTEVIYSPLVDKTIKDFVTNKIEKKDLINYTLSILLNPSERTKIVRERNRILLNLKADKKITYLCEAVRTIGKEKLLMRSNMNNYGWYFGYFMYEIAKRLYLSPPQAESLFCDELVTILKEGGHVNDCVLDKANRRNEFLVASKENGEYKFYTDEEARKMAKKVRKEIKKDITEMRGDVASVGYAKGRVIILPIGIGKEGIEKLKQKMSTMKKGDILVAATTGPEMIMACRKATAIVAEEGGINSHAAIISRELEIPGIVNTKIATKVLHDGDTIEVDANKGIIKIIKRYGN